MLRYACIKNNRICIISEHPINSDGSIILEIPSELSHISSKDLIMDGRIKDNKIYYKHTKKPAKELKVALVGNWKMKCGISTYSENLWPEVIKYIGDFKLFVEHNNNNTSDPHLVGSQIIADDKIIACWNRGESLQNLIEEIKSYNPDIIWIQHEFGLWSNARNWLAMMSQLADYRIIVTMHSVFHHKDKTICEAAMPEIVVHLEGAKSVLKNEKHVPGNVYVIPHGCYTCVNKNKLWNSYKSDKTFIQFGFGFRYKNWQDSIKATAILKKKYPDVFFTGLFSESPHNKVEHQVYYNELMDLITELDIKENVALLRGYQSDETLDSYMRTNQATVFPYVSDPEHEVFGASGAARMAMSKALPVITSSVNHFSDIPTIKADSPEEIADALDKLFASPELRNAQINKQIDYINENTWKNTALRYIFIFENG